MRDPHYTFTCNPYPRDGEEIPGVNTIQNIMHVYDRDLTRAELLASFQDFMAVSGYAFHPNETLQVILDE